MIKPEKTINGTKWIETIQINAEERATLEDQYGIDEDIIEYVTDNDESTNYVYDINEDDQLFIFLAPYALDKDALRYITQPFGMLLHKGVLFTFNQSGIPEVNTALYSALDNPEVKSVDAFILETLFTVVVSFIPISRAITKKRNYLDKMLNRKTKNSDLVSLSYLQQTLTFLSSAVQTNLSELDRLPKTHFGVGADQDKIDLFEDVQIEGEQVQRMFEIETQVVDRIDHTLNSLANNNLNDTMKFLTIWSLTMAVPTIISGFYGMNVKLPLAGMQYAWMLTLGISVALIVAMLIMLKVWRKMWWVSDLLLGGGLFWNVYSWAVMLFWAPFGFWNTLRRPWPRVLSRVGDLLGINYLGTHTMRKTGAYRVYTQSNYNIGLVMNLLNHSSEAMTLTYLGLDQASRETMLDQIDFG